MDPFLGSGRWALHPWQLFGPDCKKAAVRTVVSENQQNALEKLKTLAAKLEKIKHDFSDVKRMVMPGLRTTDWHKNYGWMLEDDPNPYEGSYYKVGSLWKEYVDRLKEAQKNILMLRARLEGALDPLTNLSEKFQEIERDLNSAQRSLSTWTAAAKPVSGDDLLDPLRPDILKAGAQRSGLANTFSANDFNPSDSPLYARNKATEILSALDTLSNLIRDNSSRIKETEQIRQKLNADIKHFEWNMNIQLEEFRRGSRGSSQSIGNWVAAYRAFGNGSIVEQEVRVEASQVTCKMPLLGGDFETLSFQINSQLIVGGLSYDSQYNFWKVAVVGNGTHLGPGYYNGELRSAAFPFSSEAEAQEFKQMLERRIADQNWRLPTQSEVQSKEQELTAQLEALRSDLSKLEATLNHLKAVSEEAQSQFAEGVHLWRTAVSFENNLILQDAEKALRASREERERIESKLQQLRRENDVNDPKTSDLSRRNTDLWQSLLVKSEAQKNVRQQKVKGSILRARENKLADFQRVSGFLQRVSPSWLHSSPLYAPVAWNDGDQVLGIKFKFGQLKSLGAHFDFGEEYALKSVNEFVSNFRATQPRISFLEAAGAAMPEGDSGQDDLLLLQNRSPVREPETSRPRDSVKSDLLLP